MYIIYHYVMKHCINKKIKYIGPCSKEDILKISLAIFFGIVIEMN